jgi:two-component system sensor histidine kinase UhpB
MRAVNERLLVAGVHQHELAAEANRRMAVAEQAAERSESALESSVAQTQSLARRLITAQEAERIRLAAELHDDVNQQLASLSIDLSTLRDNLPESRATLRAELDRMQQRTTDLIDTVRTLSHELHPGSLRVAGLLPALRRLCAESETHDGVVELRTTMDELTSMPDDIALTVYRVAQEALRNVVRHAHAQHTSVTLTRDRGHIRLQIADDGRGFVRHDISDGLGLLSMEERVLGVNGDLSFDSIVGIGTRIELTIPIPGPSHPNSATRPVVGYHAPT